MTNNSRTNRISFIFTKLSKEENLTTQKLAQQFETTSRIVQLDFKEYIIPLFGDDTIYYNYSQKCYSAKYPFLQNKFRRVFLKDYITV